MTEKDLNDFLVKKCYQQYDFYCDSSFTIYNGKRRINLRTFWRLLNNQGIKTYEYGRKWFEVVLDRISERSLKQRLGFFVRYGTLNSPVNFRQTIEEFNKYATKPCCFIEPKDGNKCGFYECYKYFDKSMNDITRDVLLFAYAANRVS